MEKSSAGQGLELASQWVAIDGKLFDDRFECARWEFMIHPELIGLLESAMNRNGYPLSYEQQSRWCGGDPEVRVGCSACACMGCCNHYFYELDLRYEHYKVWLEEFRKPQEHDDNPSHDLDVDLFLDDLGANQVAVLNIVRKITGLSSGEVVKHKKAGTPITTGDFYRAVSIKRDVEEAGGKAHTKVSEKQRIKKILIQQDKDGNLIWPKD